MFKHLSLTFIFCFVSTSISINSLAKNHCEQTLIKNQKISIDEIIASTPHARHGMRNVNNLPKEFLDPFILKLAKYLKDNIEPISLKIKTEQYYDKLDTIELKIPYDLTGNHLKPSLFTLASAIHTDGPNKNHQQLILNLKVRNPVTGENNMKTQIVVALNFSKNPKTQQTEYTDFEIRTSLEN